VISTGSWLDWRLGILLVLPFLVAFGWALNNWPFSDVGSIDPWLYYGYYRDLHSHFQEFGANYYNTRLSHILPGYLFYSWFEPVTANYILHFAWCYLAVLSLYYVLSSIVSKNTAFWAALLMGLDPWFLYSMGQDLTDGSSIAYGLGAAALLACAAKARRWTFLMVLSGMVFACSVNAHTFGLVYLPVLFLLFLYMNHENRRHSVWLGSVLFAAGVLLGSAVFAIIYSGLSQQNMYLVLWEAIQATVIEAPKDHYGEPFELQHLPKAFYMHINTAIWLLSAILLFTAKGRYSGPAAFWSSPATRPYGFCLTLCFLFGLLILTLDYGFGIFLLPVPYYTSFIIPFTYIGLAGVLERSALNSERHHKLAAALFLVSLTVLSYLTLHTFLVDLFSESLWFLLVFWIACLVLLVKWPAIQKIQYRRATAVALLVFAGYFLTGHVNPVWNWNEFGKDNPQETAKYLFNKVNEGREIIRAEAPGAWFWYSQEDPNHHLYITMASLRLWWYRLVSDHLPEINMSKDILGKYIVVLSAHANEFAEKVAPALKAKGIRHVRVSHKQMPYQGREVHMTFIRLVDWGLPPDSLQNPQELWSADREFLQAKLKKHVYGNIKRTEALKTQGRQLVFYPGSPQDHLASTFIDTQFTNPQKEYWIKLRMVYPPDSRPSSSCVFYIQNRKLQRLYQSPCANPFVGRPGPAEEKYFKVSGDVKQIRLVFQSRENLEPTQIPTAIRLERMEQASS